MVRFLQVVGLGLALCIFIAVVSAVTPVEPERPFSNYYPRGRLRTDPTADANAEQWYSSTLAKMEYGARPPPRGGPVAQPPLYRPLGPSQVNETYRALISYGREYLMAVRVYRGSEGAWVVANEIDFRAQGRNRATTRQLTSDEWQSLNVALGAVNFWGEQNVKPTFATDCLDWVVEGRQGDSYNVMSIGCPTTPEFKTLTEFFPRVAGWYPY